MQGSCIGPLLFTIYINDIANLFNENIKCNLYADDVRLYYVIDSQDDCFILQSAVDEFIAWSVKWQLKMSNTKCMTSRIGLCVTNMHSNHICNDSMPSPVIVRDMGIIVDANLIFRQHLRSITAKAHARCYLIFKCFLSKDPLVLYRAFVVYVRPLLEYASCSWSPCNVSGKFTKGFEGCQTLSTMNASPFLMMKH